MPVPQTPLCIQNFESCAFSKWDVAAEKYKVSDVVTVKISSLVPFGAFAKIDKGVEGLIHISQISEKRINKPEEVLKVGQKVNAKIISMDPENKKIELSIRELEGTSNELVEESNDNETTQIVEEIKEGNESEEN